jgi:flavin-dependent dehydrogenase
MGRSKITIIGAGLSGMVAGINLATEGFDVEIWDGAKTIGQLEDFHPSVHATPASPRRISNYINIDVTAQFVPCKRFVMYVGKRSYELGVENFFLVERGGRKSSLDYYLYRICLDCGIVFRFGTLVRRLGDIPEGAIVATGLNREGMEAIGVPSMVGSGIYARKKLNDPRYENCCIGWAGPYTSDYGYLSVVNDLMFYTVFTRGHLSEQQAQQAKAHLLATEGIEFPKWTFHKGYIPVLDADSLRLFRNGRILTGTIAGMIDPAGLFGIHGALMAGKIAALAVTDAEKAIEEFRMLNRNYQRVRVLSSQLRKLPGRLALLRLMFRFPGLMSPVLRMVDDGIPGYGRHWTADALRGRRKL